MPFNFLPFPFSIEVGETLLRILIGVAGILIFISSFNYERHQKFIGIITGLIFVVVGVYIYLMSLANPPITLPFVFEINNVFLQVILIIYSLYLAYTAFKQD